MRFKSLVVTVAAASALALAAVPVNAAETWKVVTTNSNWHCTDYKNHPVSDYVRFKVCIVANANHDAQAVLVVQNAASVAVSIGGSINGPVSFETCADSTLNPGFTRGCYGNTNHFQAGTFVGANATLKLNGVNNKYSSNATAINVSV
ncbi:hypothetical protein GTY83_26760 [Streptomyces sp. SID4928]|uniref:hypothetical protein n=1 Tax=Streptomyces TaxID=1883 RepID=UPI0001C1A5EF|nr:hypothetical protein [Streptomyces sp. ACT-1]EGE44656.1 hypothetical protein SACT1_5342 [Streptomyces sp. ACT-1]MYR52682.1 hypothetical protein [Streptomyces sp. SID4928]